MVLAAEVLSLSLFSDSSSLSCILQPSPSSLCVFGTSISPFCAFEFASGSFLSSLLLFCVLTHFIRCLPYFPIYWELIVFCYSVLHFLEQHSHVRGRLGLEWIKLKQV
eukprot:m.51396 g.51396  ORF g.51396 m.51396 type:complete len:108 (-) comp6608_c0_seq1:1557-1880(-)